MELRVPLHFLPVILDLITAYRTIPHPWSPNRPYRDHTHALQASSSVKEELIHNALHPSLQAFIRDVQPRIDKVKLTKQLALSLHYWAHVPLPFLSQAVRGVREATASFKQVIAYFGEENVNEPSAFFSIFNRLVKSFDESLINYRLKQQVSKTSLPGSDYPSLPGIFPPSSKNSSPPRPGTPPPPPPPSPSQVL